MDSPQQPAVSIQEALGNIASGNPEEFRVFFRRMRKMFPDEVTEACLWYIASRGLDMAAQNMAFWLTNENKYLTVLLDASSLPLEVASKAAMALKEADPQFLIKFLKAGEQLTSPGMILRALNLIPSLGEYSVLLSWLRKLAQHNDAHVRSRSIKLLCKIRPNKEFIERQMRSNDPRVRASAVEALWPLKTAESNELLRSAARDPHHRVVGNALVGLHLQGDPSALPKMVELCEHPEPLFRAAMAWCFGSILEKPTIPILQCLTKDPSAMVRKRALRSLLALQSDEPEGAMKSIPGGRSEPEKAKPSESAPGI